MRETLPGNDPSEETSRRMGQDLSEPSSGKRWSLRQAMWPPVICWTRPLRRRCGVMRKRGPLLGGGKGGDLIIGGLGTSFLNLSTIQQLVDEFHIPPSFTIYVPSPDSRPCSPL
ncbi:UNVERIFIED_CONTAM: hypothetical protein Slati_0149600 [Sesamum latifolium]|uniref:Uncharacterized protein n=1 Tax=Sesamum latifolium TaxID=2727402 RepID=A0AAW2YAA6_9LAMI